MSKSFNKGFFFQWSPAIQDNGTNVTVGIGNTPGIRTGISGNLTATVANFFPKLNWAKQFNFARVLHNSSLLMENEHQGTISASTTVPDITLSGGNVQQGGTSAEVSVTVEPKIIGPSENMIQLVVSINVAAPEGGKGTTSRQISTKINVRDGSSAVIGGLTSSFLNQGYNNDPQPTNAQPILNLHSSKKYNTNKNQFVVFITPLIKSSASIGVDRIKEKFRVEE